MLTNLEKFRELIKDRNNLLFLYNYEYLFATENLDKYRYKKIYNNAMQSKVIIIDHYMQNDEKTCYFIISFFDTLITIKESSVQYLKNFLSFNLKVPICFLSEAKKYFYHYINTKYNEIDNNEIFQEEITSFKLHYISNQNSSKINDVLKIIGPSIFGFLIKNSYLNINRDRFDNFRTYKNENLQNINENDFIVLRKIVTGCCSTVDLIYHIQKRKLFALKKPLKITKETRK